MGFTQKFRVTPDGYEAMANEISSRFGLSLQGSSGQIERNGFKGSYQYEPESGDLIIQLDKTPWMVADSMVKSTIKSTIAKFGGEEI